MLFVCAIFFRRPSSAWAWTAPAAKTARTAEMAMRNMKPPECGYPNDTSARPRDRLSSRPHGSGAGPRLRAYRGGRRDPPSRPEPRLVFRAAAVERARLAARRRSRGDRRDPWRARGGQQRPQLPLSKRGRSGRALGGAPGRPREDRRPRHLLRLLGRAADRAYHPQLVVRGRAAPGHLDRDAQDEGPAIFRDRRLLPAVRADLR